MRADIDDISTLFRIQEIDMGARRARKQLDELPQRKAIIDARVKKRAIAEKADQVAKLRSRAEEKLASITDEDKRLQEKQAKVQKEIDDARGDFRNLGKRTKELDGAARRRGVLEDELSQVSDELAKIDAVQAKIDAATAEVEREEAVATEGFVREGGALKKQIADLEAERAHAVQSVPDDLAALYEKTAARTGGVALARLQENRCGACRSPIEAARIVDMRANGDLGTCPTCGRILVLK